MHLTATDFIKNECLRFQATLEELAVLCLQRDPNPPLTETQQLQLAFDQIYFHPPVSFATAKQSIEQGVEAPVLKDKRLKDLLAAWEKRDQIVFVLPPMPLHFKDAHEPKDSFLSFFYKGIRSLQLPNAYLTQYMICDVSQKVQNGSLDMKEYERIMSSQMVLPAMALRLEKLRMRQQLLTLQLCGENPHFFTPMAPLWQRARFRCTQFFKKEEPASRTNAAHKRETPQARPEAPTP